MIVTMDERLRKKITKDGSHLKYTRTIGGIGMGLIAVGMCLFVISVLTGSFLIHFFGLKVLFFSMGIGLVFCGIFMIPGILLRKKKMNHYLNYYIKKSNYTEAQLQSFEQEFQNPAALFINPYSRLNNAAKMHCGILTEHWIKLPYMTPVIYSGIYRLVDIAAMWFEEKPYVNGNLLKPSMFVIDSVGRTIHYAMKKDCATELIKEMAKRNRNLITVRRFSVDNQEYDAFKEPKKVAELYRIACSK